MISEQMPIPLPLHLLVDYDDDDGVDCDQSAADVGRFSVPFKCEVYRALLSITETCAGGDSTPVVAFDKRVTIGSDTGRGAADIANFALSTTAAGKVMYDEAGEGTILYPGDEVVVQLVTAAAGDGAAGHFIPHLLVIPIPEVVSNLTDMVATA